VGPHVPADDESTGLRERHQRGEGGAERPCDGGVEVVGDAGYVIVCFRQELHVKWESNGWRNYSKKPVANRDEWERLFAAWRAREAATTWKRVKGHDGDRWNEIVDALAVEAKGYC